MTNQFHKDITQMVGDIVIYSPVSYSFIGEDPIQVQQGAGTSYKIGNYSHPAPENPLVQDMQWKLYDRYYTRKTPVVAEEGNATPSTGNSGHHVTSNQELLEKVRAANAGSEYWDSGWQIYQMGKNGQIFVQKRDRSRGAMPGEYVLMQGMGAQAQVGAQVSIRVQPESLQMQEGFYFAFSQTLSDQFDDYNTVRFYFNCLADDAPAILKEISTTLNKFQIPYSFKCILDRKYYERADMAVLYFARRYFPIVAEAIADFPKDLLGRLVPVIPMFCKEFLPGIGTAEDPGTGESFGMHRCRLVAEGIVDAWSQGQQTPEARFSAVQSRFVMNGMDFDRPYLTAGSVDLLELPNTNNGTPS